MSCRLISSVKYSTQSISHFLSTKKVAKAGIDALVMEHQAQVMEGRISDMRHILGNGERTGLTFLVLFTVLAALVFVDSSINYEFSPFLCSFS